MASAVCCSSGQYRLVTTPGNKDTGKLRAGRPFLH
jgi:hypothetical protein